MASRLLLCKDCHEAGKLRLNRTIFFPGWPTPPLDPLRQRTSVEVNSTVAQLRVQGPRMAWWQRIMPAEDTRKNAGGRQEQDATRQSEEPEQRTSRNKGETKTSNENSKKGHGQLCISPQNTGTAAIKESVGGATGIPDTLSNVKQLRFAISRTVCASFWPAAQSPTLTNRRIVNVLQQNRGQT